MLQGLHHTLKMCVSSEAVVSAKLVGPVLNLMANAGVEYMVTAGSNPASPEVWRDLSPILSPRSSIL